MKNLAKHPFTRLLSLLLVVAVVGLWFGTLGSRHLANPDEGRYAEIAREMVASGDWVTPRLNGFKYFEKPPLQYWATAMAYRLFGEHEWTARLWTALTGALSALAIFYAGGRLFGREAGFYAALVLLSSFLFVLAGHINTLDMGVTCFMTLGLTGFLLAQQRTVSTREARGWMHVSWVSLGLSLLSKGLIGIVLPGAVLVIYSLLQRDVRHWKRLHLRSGIPLMLLIAAPWYVAVSLKNLEFARFFFVHEHLERFLTDAHGRSHPWWSYIPIVLVGALPWVGLLPGALARAWEPQDTVKSFQPRRFLVIWVAFIFLFFSVSHSKLPFYVLPIFPALALLIGKRLAELSPRAIFWQVFPVTVLTIPALWLAARYEGLDSSSAPHAQYEAYSIWLVGAAAVLMIGSLFALYQSYSGHTRAAVIGLALSSLVGVQIAMSDFDALSPVSSDYRIATRIQPFLRQGEPFYVVDTYRQSLPFYLKRTLTLVAYKGEFEFGIQQEPEKWLPDLAAFERVWQTDLRALAIMKTDTLARLQQYGLPMRAIAEEGELVVVEKTR